ncbi:MAG: hypothetical protein LBJ67_09760 [Planctomycetaceae bacterium]|nr:hypothetical protein [Planctomycetaceae bacterium]
MKSWTVVSFSSLFLFAVVILAENQRHLFAQSAPVAGTGIYPPQYPNEQFRGMGNSNTPNPGGNIPAYRPANPPAADSDTQQQTNPAGYAAVYPQTGYNGTPNAATIPNGSNFSNGNLPSGTNVSGGNPADNPNYMMDRPLGAPLGGNPPTGTPSVANVPFQTLTPNAPQIIPPPKGYTLTKAEHQDIERFLMTWQEKSKSVTALDYDFLCFEYNAFSKKDEKTGQLMAVHTTYGSVKYRAPDKGIIETVGEHDANGNKITESNLRSKFICTGTAVYQFDHAAKKLTEFVIPKEQQGKGVMDSPLMVLVGANPTDLQRRFYLKILPRLENMKNGVRFQAWPKLPEDAKEFNSVIVVIDDSTFDARGLQLFSIDGTSYKNYIITDTKKGLFQGLGSILPPLNKDDFDHNNILKSKPKDWVYALEENVAVPAAAPQLSQQNPVVPNAPNNLPSAIPNTTPAQPNPAYASPVPPQTQYSSQPNGFTAGATGIASVPGQYLQGGVSPTASPNGYNLSQGNPPYSVGNPQGFPGNPQGSQPQQPPYHAETPTSRWR